MGAQSNIKGNTIGIELGIEKLGNELKKAQESARVCDSIFKEKSCENTRAKMMTRQNLRRNARK